MRSGRSVIGLQFYAALRHRSRGSTHSRPAAVAAARDRLVLTSHIAADTATVGGHARVAHFVRTINGWSRLQIMVACRLVDDARDALAAGEVDPSASCTPPLCLLAEQPFAWQRPRCDKTTALVKATMAPCLAPRAAAAIILSSPAAPDIADFFLPNREKTDIEDDVELVVLLST